MRNLILRVIAFLGGIARTLKTASAVQALFGVVLLPILLGKIFWQERRRIAAAAGISVVMMACLYGVIGMRDSIANGQCFREAAKMNTSTLLHANGIIAPERPAFGDVITAVLIVRTGQERIALETFSVTFDFAPYQQMGPIRHTSLAGCALIEERWEVDLICNESSACLPENLAGKRFEALISYQAYRVTAGGNWVLQERLNQKTYIWPALEINSRISAEDIEDPILHAGSIAGPDVPLQAERLLAGRTFQILGVLIPLSLFAVAYIFVRVRNADSAVSSSEDPDMEMRDAILAVEAALNDATVREALHRLAHVLRSHPDTALQQTGQRVDRWVAAEVVPNRDKATALIQELRERMPVEETQGEVSE